MKKILGIVLVTVLFIVIPSICGYIDTHYTKECSVTNVELSKNIITVVDDMGEEWEFIGEGFRKDDKVKVTFNTNLTTARRNDDTITNAKVIR